MKKPSTIATETYDLRVEGKDWWHNLSEDGLFYAVHLAYSKHSVNADLLFLIRENYTGLEQETYFCMPLTMWEAVCESPSVMRMYLQLGWEM